MNFQSGQGAALPSRLRIVESAEVFTPEQERAARSAIARENHASRILNPLGPDDARWLLAQEVEQSIEGGRSGATTPGPRTRA